MKPGELIPRTLVTPMRRPAVANCPTVEKRNGRFVPPSIAAVKLRARVFPSRTACWAVGGCDFPDKGGTIADCVNVLPPWNLKEGVDDDPPAVLLARQSREQRMNRVPSSPNQRIGDDSTAIAELNGLVGGSSDLHIGPDLDPALRKLALCVPTELFLQFRENDRTR